MSINANFLVSITPRVISAGSADLVTNGLVLTKSDLIPADTPALEFGNASDVASYFGAESPESDFATQYFTGVNNQQKAPETLYIARRIAESVGAWIKTAPLPKLNQLQTITDGNLEISVNGSKLTATGLDLSSATSYSDVAEKLTTALGEGVTGSYNSNQNVIYLTTTETGSEIFIDYAEVSDTSTALGLTQASGAVVSSGSDALTENANLNLVTAVSRNWVGFTTLWETELEEAQAFATWADIDDDYIYVDWSTDTKLLNQETQTATKAYELSQLGFNCLAEVYGTQQYAALILAVGASIDWSALNGVKTWFAKSTSGLNANVLSDSVALALDNLHVNYLGAFATRNAEFIFLNRGSMLSGIYGFLDVAYSMIWFKSRLQRSIMDGFAITNKVPYTPEGYAYVEAWLLDPINDAKYNGTIDTGLDLSESQVVQLLSETGNPSIKLDLYSKGYWYKIESPSANVRTERGSPRLGVWYTYGGSVQKVDCPLSAVL